MNPETNRLEPLQEAADDVDTVTPRDAPEPERRARVQGVPGPGPNRRPTGSISWEEHEQAWRAYAKLYGEIQSAERINERGGFGYEELTGLLGHPPKTWRPSRAISGETTEP